MLKLDRLELVLTSPKSQDEFDRYYRFRWEQLRQPLNLPAGSERDQFDRISYHCMALTSENVLVGVGSIQPQENSLMRIRYMAVDSHYQRLGIGALIVKDLMAYAANHQAVKCWLNARAHAVKFYQKQGFEIIGEVETELLLPHFKMETSLIA